MEDIASTELPKSSSSIQEQLNLQQEALTKIYASVEKTRKYIFWTTVANVLLFVLPLIVVAFAFPLIMNTFTSSVGGLTTDTGDVQQGVYQTPSLRESLDNLQGLGF